MLSSASQPLEFETGLVELIFAWDLPWNLRRFHYTYDNPLNSQSDRPSSILYSYSSGQALTRVGFNSYPLLPHISYIRIFCWAYILYYLCRIVRSGIFDRLSSWLWNVSETRVGCVPQSLELLIYRKYAFDHSFLLCRQRIINRLIYPRNI